MGFLSKLMKNPLVQMALPMALTAVAGPAAGALSGKFGLFKGMSPLMANALKQSALGFGTGVLSGSKRPWKSAMYAGLTSIPFSYMSAANAANTFNEQYAGERGLEKFMEPQSVKAIGSVPGAPGMTRYGFGEPSYGIQEAGPKLSSVSPWNVATGRYPEGKYRCRKILWKSSAR